MADYDFKLVIGDKTFEKNNNTSNEYCLHGIKFNRKIYQPGEIEAEISLLNKKTVSELTNMLLMKEVKLTHNNETIAENYYVHEILPQEKKNDTGIFVKLMIYSMDKLMTLDKYSKVYTGMKLGAEILNKERLNFKLGNTAVKVDFGKMRMLKYMYSRVISNKGQTGKNISIEIPSEFIQPYLVQYNESFYDFLSRTANRCGEFLYFEDGKLVLGLKTRIKNTEEIVTREGDKETVTITKEKELDPTIISDYDSVTYKSISTSKLDIQRYARDTMKDKWGVMENTNYDIVKKNKAGYPNDAFPGHTAYNSELASDEFFFPLYADKFSTYDREIGMDGTSAENAATQLFPKFADITANMQDIVDFGFKLGLDEVKTVADAKKSAADKNKDGNDAYINIGDTADKARMLEKGDGEERAVPFGTLSKEGWTTLDYYRDVRKYEEQLQRDIICIDMGTNYANVKLGDKIKLSKTGDPYTVIQILMVNDNEWTHTYTDYEGHTSPKTQANKNQKIFAIPYLKSEEEDHEVYKPYPPMLDAPVVRKAEPQTAFITASNDPKLQGRVRIVYPWQTDSTGDMKKLADAEAEYEKAQKDYLEKKQKQENLEKELDVLKKEKQLLEDNKTDKDKTLGKINEDIKTLNKDLGENNDQDDALKDDDITDFLVAKESNKCATLEKEVNELELKFENEKNAKLRVLESEKAQLQSELADLEAQMTQLVINKNALIKTKDNESNADMIASLEAEIKKDEDAIDKLNEKIQDKKTKIANKEKEISDLIDNTTTDDAIKKTESDLDAKKKKLDAQREKYQLVQQKKKIQEYYAELNSTQVEDIKNKIAVYNSKKELTGGKEYDLKQAKEATKAAKKELSAKEKAVNDMGKKVKNAIGKMASPWIRMTSPMATDGGGTIFKPRLGDEVLINYECGNVERPYVVGSLFSKNVLEPDERINRQVGPNLHKGASIAIVSPNGHGITFKDPSSGDGFVSSVYPGLGVVSKYSKGWGKNLPQAKDLAGGIRIGDRYGLYSIDMSSDRRSVKITSSLGTVSLNAFTGITISAPNGDIKIEGKNVSIKAGNNLEISSGNNIDTRKKLGKKFKWSDWRDGAEGIGKKLVSQAVKDFVSPFVDVSLARSVWETILRPVEGTALIKSHRYMKLEAGSGKAMIQHNRYSSAKNELIVSSDEMKKTENIIKQIVLLLTEINTKIDTFCGTYKHCWDNCVIERNYYDDLTNGFLIKEGDPDIRAEMKNLVNSAWADHCLDSKFTGKLQHGAEVQGGQIQLAILDAADTYAQTIYTLYWHLKSLNSIYHLPANLATLSQEEQDAKNALKTALVKLAQDHTSESWFSFYNKNPKKFLTGPEPSDDFGDKVFLKRKWAALLLAELSDKKDAFGRRTYEFVFECLDGKMPSDGTIKNNYKWNSFVSNLEKYKMLHPWVRSLFDTVIKKPLYEDVLKPFANPVRDVLIWNENEAGDILLSQDPDCTVNFKGGSHNKVTDANTGNLDHLKKKLLGLK